MVFHLFKFFLLFELLLLFVQNVVYLQNVKPDSLGQIQHIIFMQDKNQLFFTSSQHSIVGYIQLQTGFISKIYAYSPEDKLLRIDKTDQTAQFLSQDNKIYFFNYQEQKKYFIDQKYEIKQIKSFAYLNLQNQLYVLDNQKLTFYNDQNLQGKNIVNQSKRQRLIDVIPFEESQKIILVYTKIQNFQNNPQAIVNKICLKQFKKGELTNQNCFKARDINIIKVYRNDNLIQIQTPSQNYIAHGFYGSLVKFQGRPLQSFDQEVILDEFKSYRVFSKAYYDYLIVQSSNQDLKNFKLLDKQKSWGLYKQNTFLRKISKQEQARPYRSWIHQIQKTKIYYLLYQGTDNFIWFYEISDQNPYLQGSTENEKWKIKGVKKQKRKSINIKQEINDL